MKKKLLSLALALALSLGLAVPAMAYDIQSGNTVWTASNAPTGTETVKIAQLEFVSPPVENVGSKGNLDLSDPSSIFSVSESLVPTTSFAETEAQLFPVGTVITLKTPGRDPVYTGGYVTHNCVFLEKFDSEGHALDNSTHSTDFSMTITNSDTVYCLYTGMAIDESQFAAPQFVDFLYIKGVKIDAPTPIVGSFTDVKSTDYFADAVLWAVEKKITSGTSATTFSPGATCSKAQILTFLWRANGSPEPTAANPFTDIKTTDYYYKAALWAAEKGLVSGSTFGANTDCTRAMTVEYLWKAAGSPAASSKISFTDVPANADYVQAVTWAVENEITSGTGGGNFSPAATCTRGQIVTFLYRAMG